MEHESMKSSDIVFRPKNMKEAYSKVKLSIDKAVPEGKQTEIQLESCRIIVKPYPVPRIERDRAYRERLKQKAKPKKAKKKK